MQCRNCGADLADGADFCVACSSFVDAEPVAAASAPVEHPIALLLAERRYEEALDACTQALEAAPEDALLQELLGDIQRARGQLRDAAQAYKQAVKLAPAGEAALRRKLDAVIDALAAPASAPSPADAASTAVELKGGKLTPRPDTQAEAALPRWLTPRRAAAIIVLGLVLLAAALWWVLRPAATSYLPPEQAVPLSLDQDTTPESRP